MNAISLRFLFPSFLLAILLINCKQEENLPYKDQAPNLPEQLFNYAEPNVPSSFNEFVSSPAFDISDAKATLGRVLFYDKKLSLTNKTSCGSCHLQEKAFADIGAGSEGFDGKVTSRNSMAIINSGMDDGYFWDLRESSLEEMVLKPIENHIEMGMEELDKLPGKLAKADYYLPLFNMAFGSEEITEEKIGVALGQFLRSMLSANSRLDKNLNESNWTFGSLTEQEEMGFWLFKGIGNCDACHGGINFNQPELTWWNDGRKSANIGLDLVYEDGGLGELDPTLEGEFKIPSLRNIALTSPYMHDGRFQTLEEVVDHYSENMQAHSNLDGRLANNDGSPRILNLSAAQKERLIAFLHTLTDEEFVSDERFSNPFK